MAPSYKAPRGAKRPFATPPPNVSSWTVDSWVTNAEARALIASRDLREGDDDRSARQRAGTTLANNVRARKLALADKARRLFRAGELGRFLRTTERFRGKFDDVPADAFPVSVGELASADEAQDAYVLPGDLWRCHAEITRLHREIEALAPDAEKWRAYVAQAEAKRKATP